MARAPRIDVGGEIYHCLNRSVSRQQIFNDISDYQLFEGILEEIHDITAVDILAYTVMPNHFHLVLKPESDGNLSDFMKRLTVTHTQRHRVKTKTVGEGPVYQGRYKSFLVQEDSHLLTILRYVERNPLTANLVANIKEWKHGSVYRRYYGTQKEKELLTQWPIPEQEDYLTILSQPLTSKEFEKLALSRDRGVPYGSDGYVFDKIEQYNLQTTQREKGRPRIV
ncbi:transposase [Candidatus Pacebacteria bacterium]|nr:transposase [Candidatus Paceibacterota bacterium]